MLWELHPKRHGQKMYRLDLNIPWIIKTPVTGPEGRDERERFRFEAHHEFTAWLGGRDKVFVNEWVSPRPDWRDRRAQTFNFDWVAFPEPYELAVVTFSLGLRTAHPHGPMQRYRLIPPFENVFDLRQIKEDVGQNTDPWIQALPGVYEEYGVVFQGPMYPTPLKAEDLAGYPQILVALDQYLESR